MVQLWSSSSVQQLNRFWNRAFVRGWRNGCCTAVLGRVAQLHRHLCAMLCCILLSQFQRQGSAQPSRKQYKWWQSQRRIVRGRDQTFWMAQNQTQLPELLHHSHRRIRNLCVYPVTKESQGTMLCHQALCLFSAIHSRFKFYNLMFCQYPWPMSSSFEVLWKDLREDGYLYCAQCYF